jgi:hypothetical protein
MGAIVSFLSVDPANVEQELLDLKPLLLLPALDLRAQESLYRYHKGSKKPTKKDNWIAKIHISASSFSSRKSNIFCIQNIWL